MVKARKKTKSGSSVKIDDRVSLRVEDFLNDLSNDELQTLSDDWLLSARKEQLPPKGKWQTWLLLGGRGSGKTRAGAEWVHDIATGGPLSGGQVRHRIALVAETLNDAREIMVDGDSGILKIAKRNRPSYEPSRRRLVWPTGAIAQIFSSEDPESLRGPQFDAAWCDELCKWHYDDDTWDMLQFGLRLGDHPQQLVTTTPKATTLLRQIMSRSNSVTVRMRTRDNEANLAAGFIANIEHIYAGTRLGRQELDGEILEDRDGALWSRTQLEALRTDQEQDLNRIVIAIDPPASASAKASCCGIVVAGLSENGTATVLKDASIEGASPAEWSNRAVQLYHEFEADQLVAEVNQGGDMVRAVLQASDANVPVQMVRATRGKWLRAEPVAALYERDKVRHFGAFEKLEDQMCNFTIQGLPANGGGMAAASPDRLDALVWALTALCLDKNGTPIIRTI